MLRKQHWKKNILQQEGVSETRSHWKTVKGRASHSQSQLTSLKRHWSERTGQSPDEGHEQGMFRSFFGEVTEGDYVEPKTVYAAKHGDDWDQWHRAMKDAVKAL